MKRWMFNIGIIMMVWGMSFVSVHAEETQIIEQEEHNWIESSEDYHEIEAGTHDFSYWKNFMKYNRTCLKTNIIRTVVYYCDIHDHTKSESILHDTKHSLEHGE